MLVPVTPHMIASCVAGSLVGVTVLTTMPLFLKAPVIFFRVPFSLLAMTPAHFWITCLIFVVPVAFQLVIGRVTGVVICIVVLPTLAVFIEALVVLVRIPLIMIAPSGEGCGVEEGRAKKDECGKNCFHRVPLKISFKKVSDQHAFTIGPIDGTVHKHRLSKNDAI